MKSSWVIAVAVDWLGSALTLELKVFVEGVLEQRLHNLLDLVPGAIVERIFIYLLPPFL
jgi:hypothetical protein